MWAERAMSRFRVALALSLAIGAASPRLRAAPAADVEADEPIAPVVVDGRTLLRVRGVAALPAPERAQRIAERIAAAAGDPAFDPATLRVQQGEVGSEILAGERRLMVVTDADAAAVRLPRTAVAAAAREVIQDAMERFRVDRRPAVLGHAVVWTLAIAVALAVVLAVLVLLSRRLDRALEERVHRQIRDVEIASYKLIDSEQIWTAVRGTLRAILALLGLAAGFVSLGLALRQFPWTRAAANNLFSYLLDPLRAMGRSLLGALPNLIFLVVLLVIVRWALKAARLFFGSVKRGKVTLRGFDPTWADPTYRLVRIGVIAFGVIVAYPYIPGSSSDAFKAVSIFGGILFSLGSSSIIASVIAGYAMTYRRTFRLGDRVEIGEVVGDVEQIGVMVTRLRTIKNEEVVIPNSSILQGHVVNYSTHAKENGLILHTRVGIGYEIPWRQVEAMLLLAADRTPRALREPRPFVRQLELADFCVNYQLNVYCDDAHAMQELYTGLHRSVLDVFNEHGVQIMTPAYEGDPEQAKIVPRDQWYAAPAAMEPSDPGNGRTRPVPPAATAK
jgi:small-conductance mechanosensitive channel